ncbi:unnamed protein product [Arabidopsis lyrata]|uniref:Uncharacterized protein n=1 Tax=Arabidopsis lyrata subsp. lyrata TaxID=81972 RepID=D7LP85_ARALL|nr:hypothetical protein ARALYDRAFT_323054 [Arabidopsis lyrata subsp. lyrata]CAH8267239.1 unnamed protein product [Arabidopsis lyrata]
MDDSEEFSEVPDLSKWFSSYVYESPMLDTSDGLEFLEVKAKDMSQSQVEFSEDIMNLVVEDSDIDEDCIFFENLRERKRLQQPMKLN